VKSILRNLFVEIDAEEVKGMVSSMQKGRCFGASFTAYRTPYRWLFAVLLMDALPSTIHLHHESVLPQLLCSFDCGSIKIARFLSELEYWTTTVNNTSIVDLARTDNVAYMNHQWSYYFCCENGHFYERFRVVYLSVRSKINKPLSSQSACANV
jgi:hypothetical protein